MNCEAIVYQGDKDYSICLKKFEDVTGYEFTVLNKDGTAYDLTGTAHTVSIYEYKYGSLVATDTLTAATNILTWTYQYDTDIDLPEGKYYQEITFTNAAGDHKVLAWGVLTII